MATYTIHFRNEVRKVPRYLRAKKAVTAVREFIVRHAKVSDIKIGQYLNLKLWEQGIKNPITSVKVDIEKDDKGVARAELFGAPKDAPKAEPKKKTAKKAEKAADAPAKESTPADASAPKTEDAAEKKPAKSKSAKASPKPAQQ